MDTGMRYVVAHSRDREMTKHQKRRINNIHYHCTARTGGSKTAARSSRTIKNSGYGRLHKALCGRDGGEEKPIVVD